MSPWMRTLTAPSLSLALTTPLAAPVTFNTALPVSSGETVLRVQGIFLKAGNDPGPLERRLGVRILPVVVAWGLDSRWTLFGIAPFIEKRLDLDGPSGRMRRQSTGIGDLRLMARYTALRRDGAGRTFRIAPLAGIEAPTGRDDARDALGRLPGVLQAGSGSWDPFVGVVMTSQSLRQEWGASVTVRFNHAGPGFEAGDVARLDLSWHRRLARGGQGRGMYFLYAGLEGRSTWQGRDRIGGLSDEDSGGTTLALAPVLQFITRRTVIEAAIELPVAQNLNGQALEQDYVLHLGARFNY